MNESLSNGQKFNSIKHCIVCGSDQLSVTEAQGGVFMVNQISNLTLCQVWC